MSYDLKRVERDGLLVLDLVEKIRGRGMTEGEVVIMVCGIATAALAAMGDQEEATDLFYSHVAQTVRLMDLGPDGIAEEERPS